MMPLSGRKSGYDVTTGIGKTGVVGLLRNGNGPAVMLRADMDTLPVKEATGLLYARPATEHTDLQTVGGRGNDAGPCAERAAASASEDFGCFGAEWHLPSVFWFGPLTGRKRRTRSR